MDTSYPMQACGQNVTCTCCTARKLLLLGLEIGVQPGPEPVPPDPASVHFWPLLQNEAPVLSTRSLNKGSLCSCSPWSRCDATAVATCSPPPISASVFVAAHSLQPTNSSRARKTTSLSKQNALIPQGNTTFSIRIKGIVFPIPWCGERCALSLTIWVQPREHREISFPLFCLTSNQRYSTLGRLSACGHRPTSPVLMWAFMLTFTQLCCLW